MTKNRDHVFLYQEAMKDTRTEPIEIDVADPLSAFYIEVECTNGATSNKGNFISDIVTSVQVVDGSDVIENLSLTQMEAMYFYKTGKMPVMFPSEHGGGTQRHGCYLLFGTKLWDKVYNFNPAKYVNPELKITFNKAAIRAAGATGFATGDNIKLTVVGKLMEGAAGAPNVLMQKQIDSFTSVASGVKRILMPNDYTYRLMLVRLWKQLKDIDEIITNLKLTCDTDKFIPFDRKTKQLDAEAFVEFGRSILKHDYFAYHQEAKRQINNKENSSTINAFEDTTGYIVNVQYEWSSEGKFDIMTHAGATQGSEIKLTGKEDGHAMHAVLPVLFGELNLPETWFNPKTYGKVELLLTQAVADATCEIVLEQVRPQ